MDEKIKKAKIKQVESMLNDSNKLVKSKIDKALNCGALDIEQWDSNYNPMIMIKIIVAALLQDEAEQYMASGTSFEKEVKREVKNLGIFL